MQIKASTALRNEYLKISELAHASGEPVYITNKGEADLVILSIEAYEEREKMLAHRVSILEATYTADQVDAMLKEKFRNVEHAS